MLAARNKKPTDPERFRGSGISFRAKIIGVDEVPEPRGDKMCQESLQKLKAIVRSTGQHKRRVFINITLEGLKIMDGITMTTLHMHPVHQISFISRDVTDSRAFGYIIGPGDGTHHFYGIKTANAAENLVLTLRDLFQTVYEMKKSEMEETKAKAAVAPEKQEGEETPDTTYQVPPNGAPVQGSEASENIYQVPQNNAPVNSTAQEEAVANLLDLEDQADHILQDIEHIKNLDFDDFGASEVSQQPTAAVTARTSSTITSDLWGASAATVSPQQTSSSLADLEQLQQPALAGNPFGGMQAFPGTPSPMINLSSISGPFGAPQANPAPFGFSGNPMTQASVGLPVTKDPFGDDPFRATTHNPVQMMQQVPVNAMAFPPRPGFGNPFPVSMTGPIPGQPFSAVSPSGMTAPPGMATPFGVTPFGMPPQVPGMGFGLGAFPHMGSRLPAPSTDPFASDADLLQPIRQNAEAEEPQQNSQSKAPREALFGDLVDIKKEKPVLAAVSPKDLFKELNAPSKKSLNEMKSETSKPAAADTKASDGLDEAFVIDPFGSLDAVLSTVASTETNLFDDGVFLLPSVPPPSQSPPPLPHPIQAPPPPVPPDPSSKPMCSTPSIANDRPNAALGIGLQKEPSPESHFAMPDEPPPPLPTNLPYHGAPTPPPRPPPKHKGTEPPVPHRPKYQKSFSSSSSTTSSSSNSSSSSSSLPVNCVSSSIPALPHSPKKHPVLFQSSSSGEAHFLHATSFEVNGGKNAASTHHPPFPNSLGVEPDVNSTASLSSGEFVSPASSTVSLSDRMLEVEDIDPFAFPLRSKKSLSVTSLDGIRKPQETPTKSLATDPFGVPLTHRTSRTDSVKLDNLFMFSAFGDSRVSATSQEKWEVFGDNYVNGLSSGLNSLDVKPTVISSKGDRPSASPFGDSFLTPSPSPLL